MRIWLCVVSLVWLCCASVVLSAAPPEYQTVENVLYRDPANIDDYSKQQCRLDIYHPTDRENFATVIWFHGGGLTGGKRSIPKPLREQGVAVVAVSYRLSPQVKVVDCLDDAAAATAWVFRHIKEYGGAPDRIFVSGHSAGGYLTSMIGLDKHWLAAHDIDADRIAGLIPFSGHTVTHFTVRKERGIDRKRPIVDEMAPLFHIRSDAPPILFITGDRKLELLGRYEENAYMWRMMQVVGHPDAQLMELDGHNHGQMAGPAFPLLLRFTARILKSDTNAQR